MSTVSDTITKAAAATDMISAEVDRVYQALHSIQGRTINGHGVYSDPSRCRQAIAAARTALNATWDASAAVTWPSEADYDAAEQSETSA